LLIYGAVETQLLSLLTAIIIMWPLTIRPHYESCSFVPLCVYLLHASSLRLINKGRIEGV